MDDDDQSAAEAHQMELEQREREEATLKRFRLLHAELNHATKDFEQSMNETNERIRRLSI